MSDPSSQRMIPWPLTTEVNGEPDVVRDEDGEVVWTQIPAPADLAPDRTMEPLMTVVGGVAEYVFSDDGEIVATVVPTSADQDA